MSSSSFVSFTYYVCKLIAKISNIAVLCETGWIQLILEVEMIKFLFFRFYNIYWSSLLSNRSDIVLHKDNWLRKRI